MTMKFDLKQYLNPIFVETGSFHGVGISTALKAGFEKVYSIEVKQEYYDECAEKFAKEIQEGRVNLILGDSLVELGKLVPKIDRPATFWLDAHNHCGGYGIKQCPIYEELDAIAAHPIKSHTLLIDDVRLFGDQETWGKKITHEDVVKKVKTVNQDYSITYDNGFQKDDVLVARIKTSTPQLPINTSKINHEIERILNSLKLPQPEHLIHVGANLGQEIPAYKNMGLKTAVYIEPIPSVFQQLNQKITGDDNHHALQYLCSNKDGEEVTFNVASNEGQSSSMFPLGNHANLYPHIEYTEKLKIITRTLDSIVTQEFEHTPFDTLVMDTQGSELKVLQGSQSLLKTINYIYTEISENALYEGGCTFDEITEFLKCNGFRLKNLILGSKGWGNAFYVKQNYPNSTLPSSVGNLCFNKPAQQSSLSQWSSDNDAHQGVNGVKNGKFSFHTDFELNPWWQVNLENIYALTEVRIYNRLDFCSDRVRTLSIQISTDGENWQQVYSNSQGEIFGGIDGKLLRVFLVSVLACFIRVQLNEVNCLHLDEIEAYGTLA
jgi:FkbM family methyltransferase